MKTCPGCGNKIGAAAKKCGCGHEFKKAESKPVAVKVEPKPLDQRIAESIKSPPTIPADLSDEPRKSVVESESKSPALELPPLPMSQRSRGITAPAGPPPCKPRGYKEGWPDGPCPDDDVIEWAHEVMEKAQAAGLNYSPEAVRYFIRCFWDINGPEYPRIRDLVASAF